MGKAVFLDSGFLIRLMDENDSLHLVTYNLFRKFVKSGVSCKVSTIALRSD